VNKCVVYLRIK